jgi:2-(1,2-epoxy-1,2-dihydrophenyl)acetyl-CoA isomerase
VTDAAVLLEIGDDGVARLTLNRPNAANAIDLDLARALAERAQELADSKVVRAVLLSGRGDRFCGGGDVRAFAEAAGAGPGLPDKLTGIVAALHEAIEAFARVDAPIVAAVQGSAAGAGLSLVALSDLVVAAASAKFVMAYTAIGLTPDGGSTWYLPRVIGLRRAVELTLTNRALSAEEAHEWGLVTSVVSDDALTSEVEGLVARLAAGPTRSFGAAKRLLYGSLGAPLSQQLADEEAQLLAAGGRADAREGVTAFVDKRAPRFTGDLS